ncbi:sensor histidine kinase [Nakamurella deserti]|uniref:sensor histidine kinase n=1 Tax=Nakamurella deserti TaxID=2164074 RepID=UPI000DBE864B|nr:ATP-binding protein [Nakamurella deserti]
MSERATESDRRPAGGWSDAGARVDAQRARGAALHVALRWLLVAFAAATVWWEPPQFDAGLCRALVVGYAGFAGLVLLWFRRDPQHLARLTWLVLAVDLLLFGVLVQVTGASEDQSWTPYILVNGFLLIPLLAATQLRPGLGAAIGAVTTVLYFVSSAAARTYGEDSTQWEPWSSVVLRTVVVAAVALAAVLLSRVQRSRVAEIGRLAKDRAALLEQLGTLEDRQRRELAEALHDGALQYLLGARLELDEARDTGDPAAFDRIDEALTQSSRLLRSTVSELHPAVLAQAGLDQAVRDLADTTAARTGLAISVVVRPDDAPAVRRDAGDLVVYSAVREALGNVVKHAHASAVAIVVERTDALLRVTVTDDGRGIADGAVERRLAAGHIGVASHRWKVEAAGGRFLIAPALPHGTRVTVELPVRSDGTGGG